MAQRPEIDPTKTYHKMTFDTSVSDDSFEWAICEWLKATNNKLDGDIICCLDSDDYIMNKFTALVPYVPYYLIVSIEAAIPQHYNCRCNVWQPKNSHQ